MRELLELYHAHELSVHMSRDRLYYTLKKQYYLKGMIQDISRWVAACPRCSTVKTNIPTSGIITTNYYIPTFRDYYYKCHPEEIQTQA